MVPQNSMSVQALDGLDRIERDKQFPKMSAGYWFSFLLSSSLSALSPNRELLKNDSDSIQEEISVGMISDFGAIFAIDNLCN
jgi:hypothetical protein